MHVIVCSRARAIRTASDAVNTWCWTVKAVKFDSSKWNLAEEIQQTVFSSCCVTLKTIVFQIPAPESSQGRYRWLKTLMRTVRRIVLVLKKKPHRSRS